MRQSNYCFNQICRTYFQQKPASSQISVLNTTTSPTVIKIKADGYCFYNAVLISAAYANLTEVFEKAINSAKQYINKYQFPLQVINNITGNQKHNNTVYENIKNLSRSNAQDLIKDRNHNFGSALKVLANEYLIQKQGKINFLTRNYICNEQIHEKMKQHAYTSTYESNDQFIDNLEGDLHCSVAYLLNLNINRIKNDRTNNSICVKTISRLYLKSPRLVSCLRTYY